MESDKKKPFDLKDALPIAERIKTELEPFCERIEIAGSIRRRYPFVNDIEIVLIPKPYETGFFESGVASVINKWDIIKGHLPCRYTKRMLPEGITADIFFAVPENWGLILAIRTGSAKYSREVLAKGWTKKGYTSIKGMLTMSKGAHIFHVREERDLFDRIGLKYVEPQFRNR